MERDEERYCCFISRGACKGDFRSPDCIISQVLDLKLEINGGMARGYYAFGSPSYPQDPKGI